MKYNEIKGMNQCGIDGLPERYNDHVLVLDKQYTVGSLYKELHEEHIEQKVISLFCIKDQNHNDIAYKTTFPKNKDLFNPEKYKDILDIPVDDCTYEEVSFNGNFKKRLYVINREPNKYGSLMFSKEFDKYASSDTSHIIYALYGDNI